MLPWIKELSAYDNIDKLLILARALELDMTKNMQVRTILYENPSDLSRQEIDQLCIDLCRMDIYEEMQVRRERRKLEKLIFSNESGKSYFVTIGLDDKQFNEDNEAFIINPLVKKIIETPGFDNLKFVVEKFRKNEEGSIYVHRHIHLLFDCKFPKSKVIQFCFQKAKKYVSSQNFIDVKLDVGRTREKYIGGQKTSYKLECVDLDRKWRENKKIIECS